MKHAQFEKLIDEYLANELDEDVQASFEEHMLACTQCKEKLMLSQAIVDGLAACRQELRRETCRHRRLRRYRRYHLLSGRLYSGLLSPWIGLYFPLFTLFR